MRTVDAYIVSDKTQDSFEDKLPKVKLELTLRICRDQECNACQQEGERNIMLSCLTFD